MKLYGWILMANEELNFEKNDHIFAMENYELISAYENVTFKNQVVLRFNNCLTERWVLPAYLFYKTFGKILET